MTEQFHFFRKFAFFDRYARLRGILDEVRRAGMTEKSRQEWGPGAHRLKLGKSFETNRAGSGAPVYNR